MQQASPGARQWRPNGPSVVILGGGFGGLHAARALRQAPERVTLVDRRNHHMFQPLLYQVATATLNPSAKNPFGFAHLLAAQDFAQRGPLEIVLAGDRLGGIALVESVHRTYLPARVVAFAEDVPTGEGRHPAAGQPTAYVCRNHTCDARVTSAHALVERCVA